MNEDQDQIEFLDLDTRINTVYANFPADIRSRMITAADQMLGIGDNDTWRGQHLTDWSNTAINLYRMLQVDEEEIIRKVTLRLDDFLERGRQAGLSSNIEGFKLLTTTQNQRESEPTAANFESRYNMNHFREIKRQLGVFDRISYYGISLKTAFNLAMEIKDEKRALETCIHMVRLGNAEAAYKTAEKMEADRMLINLGLLSLVDFFDGKHNYHVNHLWDAIESLKRVQGDLKPEAEEILYDLAMEISSDEFIRTAALRSEGEFEELYTQFFRQFHSYALRALRVTGKLVEKVPIDSVKVDFLTKIENPRYVTAINRVILRMEDASCSDFEEKRKAQQAINDVEELNRCGEAVLRKRFANLDRPDPSYYYGQAIEFFESAGNTERLKDVLYEYISNEDIPYFRYSLKLIPLMVKIGYTDGLQKVKELASERMQTFSEEKDGQNYNWEEVKDKAQRALNGLPLTETDDDLIPQNKIVPQYVRNALIEETRFRKSLEESRAKLTPERKERLIKEGYRFLEKGNRWNAYMSFKDALHRKGLIEAGDKMIEHRDGLNARTPYLFAALLQPENPTITSSDIETRLLD